MPPPDVPPSTDARTCVVGVALDDTPGSCAHAVCAEDASCCTAGWTEQCVRRAERTCQRACAGMAFIGGLDKAIVIDLASHATLYAWLGEGISDGAWGDFNGDGVADLATAGPRYLRVYRNDGLAGGQLQLAPVFEYDWFTQQGGRYINGSFAGWADFDEDGHLDVVFAGGDGAVQVRGLGGDGFDARPFVTAADAPDAGEISQAFSPGAVGDFLGDDRADVVLPRWNDPMLAFESQAGLLVPTSYRGPARLTGVTACNLDPDPEVELVTAGEDPVMIQIVGGVFSPSALGPPGLSRHVRCGDLDGDGDADLFYSGWGNPATSLRNDAPGFKAHADATVIQESGAALGDLDGDHQLDAITVERGDQSHPLRLATYRFTDVPGTGLTFTREVHELATWMVEGRDIALAPRP